jgi:uncharacterized heparinase superfamily protein
MEYLQLSKVYVNNIHNKAGTQAISIDGDGVVKETNKIMWQVHGSNNNYVSAAGVKVAFDDVTLDTHSGFDTATNGYTAPVTGTYHVHANIYLRVDNNEAVALRIQVDGSYWLGVDGTIQTNGPYAYHYWTGVSQSHHNMTYSTLIKLNAGEEITWHLSGANTEYYSGGRECWTYGYLVG